MVSQICVQVPLLQHVVLHLPHSDASAGLKREL
jgi:hypothetical protein